MPALMRAFFMFLDSWVFWTLLAATMQSVRTAGQKELARTVSPLAATMVRYLFGLPFAVLYLGLLLQVSGVDLPPVNPVFLLCGLAAGFLQIIATVLLVRLFTLRNFAVGSTYVRTEVILTAIIGFLFFTETVSAPGWIAILVSVAGVMTINVARTGRVSSLWDQSALFGLGAGLAFALTSLFIRKASLSFGIDDSMLTAALTLCYMVALQTLMTVVWVGRFERGQFSLVVANWRPSLFVGVTSVIGSAGWFTAMTLELASYVKTLGQIEFLITLSIGWFYFRERPGRLEYLGMFLILAGVVVLLLSH
ncbi:MAG: DMT family transporter [Pseudomonadota bacterium]